MFSNMTLGKKLLWNLVVVERMLWYLLAEDEGSMGWDRIGGVSIKLSALQMQYL